MSLEDVIRSSTSLPAQILGLGDRGTLRAGAAADVVIFDPKEIRDVATAERPNQFSKGIEWVFVNGRLVVDHGNVTGVLPGRVIANDQRPAGSR